ncbi:NAD(P)H-dependent oxidoreductase [Lactobacillus sp. Sy-1]|uniref:NAD(P)H-dependent oxidoreductase n=1 Tax=Lactobacillus sp. Sy-1 TaxID=2109645 RepID=UPI001C569AAF|nr:NAD(P)H-dependent oxidoreductase [Lactobacillus sp. Sy-1]MBW1604929.1 NAD(P)H-dependent oxidoreductase [Lactobacillus sp. Sy-1]
MKKVIIVSGHPVEHPSKSNEAIIKRLHQLLPNSDFDILGPLYPDYHFNVDSEQAKLAKADVIILQFPVYWYSIPALLQKWIEETFTYGFAYGKQPGSLSNKTLLVSFTCGSDCSINTIDKIVFPLKSTASYCHMNWGGAVYTKSIANQKASDDAYDQHCNKIVQLVNQI